MTQNTKLIGRTSSQQDLLHVQACETSPPQSNSGKGTTTSATVSHAPSKTPDPSRARVGRFPELTAASLSGAPKCHDPPEHEVALVDLLLKPLETFHLHRFHKPQGDSPTCGAVRARHSTRSSWSTAQLECDIPQVQLEYSPAQSSWSAEHHSTALGQGVEVPLNSTERHAAKKTSLLS